MSTENNIKKSDLIREFCTKNVIETARKRGDKVFSITAGDIHSALQLKDSMPTVCAAIGTNAFVQDNNIKRIHIEGPLNGAKTTFVYMFN